LKRKGIFVILAGIGCWVIAMTSFAAVADSVRKVVDQYASMARSAEQRGTITIPGKEGWLFFGPELRFLSVGRFWGKEAAKVSRATKPEFADPLPAILDFHRQLKKMGVELLLVPVPSKSVVYPDFLSDQLTISRENPPVRIDSETQAFYQLLRKEGIQVLDLTSFFLANRFHREGAPFCKQDTHWSGNGCVLAARKIREEIQGRPWLKAIPKSTYQTVWKSLPIEGDLWKVLGEKSLSQEILSVRQVGTGPIRKARSCSSVTATISSFMPGRTCTPAMRACPSNWRWSWVSLWIWPLCAVPAPHRLV
jgi:hypothetical protein